MIREGILKLQSNQANTCLLNGNPSEIYGCLVQCQEIQSSVKLVYRTASASKSYLE